MKYNILTILNALEACYATDNNPITITRFTQLFCEKYHLNPETEQRNIKHIIKLIAKQKNEITIEENDTITMHNMLRSKIKLIIGG